MTNLFTRIKDAVAADLHGVIDKKEENNPITALNQYLRQSEKETEKVRKLVERQIRLNEEFSKEYEQVLQLAAKRKHQAEIAQRAGEESLYQYAMQEFEVYEAKAERMKTAREEAVQQQENLEQKYEEMKHKLKDMQYRRLELMGRENVARATYEMNKVVGDSGEKSYSRFSEMEQYIERLEKKVNNSHYHSTFDSKIAQLEIEMKQE